MFSLVHLYSASLDWLCWLKCENLLETCNNQQKNMSKGKQYFDTLLMEGMQKIMAKSPNSLQEKASCRTQNQTPRSPGPIKLRSYLSQKTKQKREDGKCSILNIPIEPHQTPKIHNEPVEPQQPANPYEEKVAELKSFVKTHIDNEENYRIFESILESLAAAENESLRQEEYNRGKSFTVENPLSSSENIPSPPQHRLSYDLASPGRLKRFTSASIPQSETGFETSMKVNSSIFKPMNERI